MAWISADKLCGNFVKRFEDSAIGSSFNRVYVRKGNLFCRYGIKECELLFSQQNQQHRTGPAMRGGMWGQPLKVSARLWSSKSSRRNAFDKRHGTGRTQRRRILRRARSGRSLDSEWQSRAQWCCRRKFLLMQSSLLYNEYVVYDPRQIRYRYLFRFKFHFKITENILPGIRVWFYLSILFRLWKIKIYTLNARVIKDHYCSNIKKMSDKIIKKNQFQIRKVPLKRFAPEKVPQLYALDIHSICLPKK